MIYEVCFYSHTHIHRERIVNYITVLLPTFWITLRFFCFNSVFPLWSIPKLIFNCRSYILVIDFYLRMRKYTKEWFSNVLSSNKKGLIILHQVLLWRSNKCLCLSLLSSVCVYQNRWVLEVRMIMTWVLLYSVALKIDLAHP